MEEIITIDNKDFFIVKRFLYNNETYLYTISVDETDEVMLLKEYDNNGETFVESVNEEEKIKEILKYMNNLN